MELYAEVIVNLKIRALDRIFSYRIPPSLSSCVRVGCAVEIPFGKRRAEGFVLSLSEKPPVLSPGVEMKEVCGVIRREAGWTQELIFLASWMHFYYGSTWIESLRTVLSPDFFSGVRPVRLQMFLSAAAESAAALPLLDKKSPRQARILRHILSCGEDGVPRQSFMEPDALRALEKKGLIRITAAASEPAAAAFSGGPPLSEPQRRALEKMETLSAGGKSAVMLLHGVPGSGKTEVYLQMVRSALSRGKTAIVLVPEISLTPQTTERFRERFGASVAIIHSRLTPVQRRSQWQKVVNGEASVVVGARSAVFAPLENLGLVIVDEEQDSAYKQESSPRYHARHVAVRRAAYNRALLVLGTATPSVESFHHAKSGRYHFASLPERVKGKMPSLKIVDMRKSYNRGGSMVLSPALEKRISLYLEKGKQIILFLNRRGFSGYMHCGDCGHIVMCRNCNIAMKLHENPRMLRCHYCDAAWTPPDLCPGCGGISLSSRGVGTQMAEAELTGKFPGARILRVDRDSMRSGNAYEAFYDSFKKGAVDILIGTQMIAKGLDFPNVGLVGILLADIAFAMPDFRSSERAYQLFVQVAGRAGRGEGGAEVLLQTFNPEHPVIEAMLSNRMFDFYGSELEARRELNYPPFSHMVRFVFASAAEDKAASAAAGFAALLGQRDLGTPIGPAPCPVSVMKKLFRYQIHVKTSRVKELAALFRSRQAASGVSASMDADALGFL